MLMRSLSCAAALLFGIVGSRDAWALPLPRGALWIAVRSCVLSQATMGVPFPCLEVQPGSSTGRGFAVLRSPDSSTHVVVMPTARIPGIESPELLQEGAGAYWRAALDARRHVVEGAGGRVPLSAIGLAVNSAETRSQDQLHIHADCIRPNVIARLQADAAQDTSGWMALHGTLEGDRYLVRTLSRREIEGGNVFATVAAMPGGEHDLSGAKVLLVDAGDGDRFVLAVTRSSRHSIESLLDGSCKAALRHLRPPS